MDLQQIKRDTKSYLKANILNLIVKKYVLEQSFMTSLYGSILSILAFNLIKWFIPKPFNKSSLIYLPVLVKLNIMESSIAAQRKKIHRKLREMRPDIFSQVWLGTFNYKYYGRQISGTIKLKSSQVFSVEENKRWLYDESTVDDILNHFIKHRVSEIPCWNGKITREISIDNQHDGYFFLPTDILESKNWVHITWKKKLIAN
jgi:hypothetical protein